MRRPLTVWHKLAFAAGATGWVIGDRLILTWAQYFYAPPGGKGLADKLPLWTLLGALTVWGAISLFGRVVDGFFDPVVASFTDRSTHRFGRRRIYMAAGIVPLTVATAAMFFPPDLGRTWTNAAFAAGMLTLYFCSFTLYACPHQALLPDLARGERERLDLSTLQAVATLVGAAIVMVGSPIVLGLFGDEAGELRFRVTAVVFALVSFGFMLVPILGIPEPALVERVQEQGPGLLESLISTFRAPGMKAYLVGNLAFWFGFNVMASGLAYFVVVLMRAGEAYGGLVLTATFALAGVCFPLVNLAAKRFGKRRVMILGSAAMAGCMCLVPLIESPVSGLIVIGLCGVPVAVLMALPNAILADLANAEAARTGQRREAMFFGAQAFFMKVNLGVSSAVLAGLIQLGASPENPLGVKLVGPATAGVLLIAIAAFWRFREPGEATVQATPAEECKTDDGREERGRLSL